MYSHSFDIRYGELLDVTGSPVRYENVTILPARTHLTGTCFSSQFHLLDWSRDAQRKLPLFVHDEANAPWILGRLIYLFNIENTPEDERSEKSCLNASFVAIIHDRSNIVVPFDCSDHYGRSSLTFSSDDEPPLNLRTEIAGAFYGLLLDEPEALADFENRMYHSGGGFWVNFGVSQGEPYYDEQVEYDD